MSDHSQESRMPKERHEVESDTSSVDKTFGVSKVEAALKVWNPRTRWFLFIGLGLSAYVYSLDGMTTYTYNAMALSSLGNHSFIATIGVVNAIMIAVGKPFMAKLADVIGRGETMAVVALLYAIGYAIVASANTAQQVAGGLVVYSMGYTGLQLVMNVIVADVTTLRWRAFVTSMMSFPFIINAFVASEISNSIQVKYTAGHTNVWRWGYGMFCIIMPVTLLPVIVALLWSQWKGRRMLRESGQHTSDFEKPMSQQIIQGLRDMDFIGLILLGFALALILLPMTLAPKAKSQWKNPSMIAMIVIGAFIFVLFLLYEWKVPRRPVLPMRWLRRRPIFAACLINFFDFVSFYLQFTYLYSYIAITQDWSPRIQNYFSYTQTLCLTFFAIMAGVIMYATRRFKWMLVVGLLIRLLGVGIMFHARGPNGNVASLVMCQVLQGMGGGIASITTTVAAQASVSHADLATVYAVVLLLSEVGNSVGTAAAGGVWAEYMPKELAKHVPTTNSTLLTEIFTNIYTVPLMPEPIKEGVITAYQNVMHRLLIGSVIVACFPPIFAFFLIKDIRLTDTQNAFDGKNNAGEQVEEPDEHYVQERREEVERAREKHVL